MFLCLCLCGGGVPGGAAGAGVPGGAAGAGGVGDGNAASLAVGSVSTLRDSSSQRRSCETRETRRAESLGRGMLFGDYVPAIHHAAPSDSGQQNPGFSGFCPFGL